MTTFVQVLASGILLGGVYGLFSSGLTLIFGITRVINFAHGDFVALGMYATVIVFTLVGVGPLYAVVPVALGWLLLGAVVYTLIMRRTLAIKGISAVDAMHGQLILTLGISILLSNLMLMAFGPAPVSAGEEFTEQYNILGVFIGQARLISFVVSVAAFLVLYVALIRTLFGKAIRATVDDADMASMVGINPNRIYAVCFSIGIMLAGIAGCVLALFYPVTPTTGSLFITIAFVTVVMGGLGNVPGAFVAGIVVGVVQQLTAVYVAIDLQNAGLFIVFVLLLIYRPQGILVRGPRR